MKQEKGILTELARKYGTDKIDGHTYTPIYERYFADLQPNLVFEIGVGGYGDPHKGGASLRMWRDYFPTAQIISLDIHPKEINEERIAVYQGSQTDWEVLKKILERHGLPDIIIDDGSHVCADVIRSFELLFPTLPLGGWYVVEDTQTSYLPELKGGTTTTMEYFLKLADNLNYRERLGEYYATYFDEQIFTIHFYHNLIFIQKGDNTEESNQLINNCRR